MDHRERVEVSHDIASRLMSLPDSILSSVSRIVAKGGYEAQTLKDPGPTPGNPVNKCGTGAANASTTGVDQRNRESHDIGWAIKKMSWEGLAVTRIGWNGKGMFLRVQFPDRQSKMTRPYVYMVTADQQRIPWLCSQADLLATDWDVFITE